MHNFEKNNTQNHDIPPMKAQFTQEKLIAVFCFADDTIQLFDKWLLEKYPDKRPILKGGLCGSEIATILIMYHVSGYKCFEYYYKEFIINQLRDYFPYAPGYKQFLSYIPKVFDYIFLLQMIRAASSERTGTYFVDSKKLPVCHNRRIHSHRVFAGIAGHGKSSTGWFYGLKIHLVINHLGDIVSTLLTPANVADNNAECLKYLLKDLKGVCFGDKGYLTKEFGYFLECGLQLITKVRRNMKNQLITLKNKLLLNKRGIIESVNDILMTVLDIDHRRHRSPVNAMVHIYAGTIAYQFLDNKPTIILNQLAT